MKVKSVYDLIRYLSKEFEIDELFKELGLPEDEDTKLFVIGVLTGLLQIVKRGNTYYVRVTPPQNLPYHLFKDLYPENTRKAIEIKMKLAKQFRGDLKKVGEVMRKLKEQGVFAKEEKLLTEEQKKKLIERLLRLL